MRVGQLQILTGDEIRDGQKLRTPLNVGRERERERQRERLFQLKHTAHAHQLILSYLFIHL